MKKKSEAKRKLFWYDVKTWLGVALFIGLTAPFAATGIADVFGGLFVFAWWHRRQAYRPLYEASLGVGRLYQLTKEADEAYRAFDRFCLLRHFEGEPLCPTCQSTYYIGNENLLCASLREVYPHCPSDPAPQPNPYEWAWFKYNGYAPPPQEWPKSQFYLSPLDPCDYEAMEEEGKLYYEKHGNPLWDAGYGRVPLWYVRRDISLPRPSRVTTERVRLHAERVGRRPKTTEEKKQWHSLESVAETCSFDIPKFVEFATLRKSTYGIIGDSVSGFKMDSLIGDFRIYEVSGLQANVDS